jgi:hypothetical protein
MIPILMTLRGKGGKSQDSDTSSDPGALLFSKLLRISYVTKGSCREAVNEKMLYFDDFSAGV